MTDNEIRIAVAEACGWKVKKFWPLCDTRTDRSEPCINYFTPSGEYTTQLPDYLNDLNATHQAEETLNEKERGLASRWICDAYPYWNVYHATARQRCEAFLRTKGLLNEPKP